MKQLYFVRHGETEWNAISRMQGQWNSDLSERGLAQAEVHGQLLAGLQIDAVYASPLGRTRQTAEIANRYLNLSVEYDDRLKEWDCGDWSGHLYADVMTRWADEWQALRADPYHYRGPNCENHPDMIARSTPFLNEVLACPARNVAIISHGLIGRIMVSTVLGFDEEATVSFHQSNDTVFRVTLDGENRAVAHYVAGKGPFDGIRT